MDGGMMFIFFFDKNSHVMLLISLRIAQTHFRSILVIGLYKGVRKKSSHTKVVVWFEEADRIHWIFAFQSPVQGMEAHNDVFWSEIYSKLWDILMSYYIFGSNL